MGARDANSMASSKHLPDDCSSLMRCSSASNSGFPYDYLGEPFDNGSPRMGDCSMPGGLFQVKTLSPSQMCGNPEGGTSSFHVSKSFR